MQIPTEMFSNYICKHFAMQGVCLFFRVGFWQNGFFRGFLFLGRRIFSRIFSPDFFSSFLWGKKCPEKSSRKIPAKILQNLYNKNPPTHFCRMAGAIFWRGGAMSPKLWPVQCFAPCKSWLSQGRGCLSSHHSHVLQQTCWMEGAIMQYMFRPSQPACLPTPQSAKMTNARAFAPSPLLPSQAPASLLLARVVFVFFCVACWRGIWFCTPRFGKFCTGSV